MKCSTKEGRAQHMAHVNARTQRHHAAAAAAEADRISKLRYVPVPSVKERALAPPLSSTKKPSANSTPLELSKVHDGRVNSKSCSSSTISWRQSPWIDQESMCYLVISNNCRCNSSLPTDQNTYVNLTHSQICSAMPFMALHCCFSCCAFTSLRLSSGSSLVY